MGCVNTAYISIRISAAIKNNKIITHICLRLLKNSNKIITPNIIYKMSNKQRCAY